MPKLTDDLRTLYRQLIEQWSAEERSQRKFLHRECIGDLRTLNRAGIQSVAELLKELPGLPTRKKAIGIQLIRILNIRQGIPVLLELMADPEMRVSCAVALEPLKPGTTVTRHFLTIGIRELRASTPDYLWLDAVVCGIGHVADSRAVELLVTIFERSDLPGWLRGNAADKLGCCDLVRDRRTRLFRRCRTAALRGLSDDSIDVQFWSMYVIGSMCSNDPEPHRSRSTGFESLLPNLREFAANDHRLAPGYWWPMSAEAEDVIGCIQTGHWPTPDAAERWQRKAVRN